MPESNHQTHVSNDFERRFVFNLCVSAAICAASAGPSIMFASGQYPLTPVLLIVAGFTLGIASIRMSRRFQTLVQAPGVRRALRIAYGCRIAITVILPLAMVVDMILGEISIALVNALVGGGKTHLHAALITLVGGLLMNAGLIGFAFTIYILSGGRFEPAPPPEGHCAACGYDLTGNESGRCPECGIKIGTTAVTIGAAALTP